MALSIKSPSEVSVAIKKMVVRADAAVQQKNWGYVFEILRDVLRLEPGFSEARFKLREAQLEKIGRQAKPLRQLLATLATAWPIAVLGPMKLQKGDFSAALDIAEKAMEADPTVLPTLKFLAKAADAAGLRDVAMNALEVAAQYHPKNPAVTKQLADLYQKYDEGIKGVQALQKLVALQPNNLDAQNRLKHATALAAMQGAKWDKAGSFTEMMKDQEQQELLEQSGRLSARDEDSRLKLINATLAQLEKQPGHIASYRRLAELYHQNGNFDQAIDCFRKIPELTATRDPAIDSAITVVLEDKFNAQIKDLEAQLAAEPENAEAIQAGIETIAAERDAVLLERYEQRVADYPNELPFRLDLGLVYFKAERIDEAMEQFQLAQRHTHIAAKAHLYMGKCLVAKGLPDLAIEQLEAALTDRDRMRPSELKETLYDLALAHEARQDRDKALTTLKELYGIDVAFRDVAQRLEGYYR